MLHLFIDSTNCAVTATCHPRNKLVAIWTSTPWRSQHLSENSPRLCLAWNRPVTPLLQQVCMCQGNLWIRKIRNIQYVIYGASWWMHEITENRRCPIHMRREGVSMTFKHVWNPFQTVSNTSEWTFQTRETCFMAFEKKNMFLHAVHVSLWPVWYPYKPLPNDKGHVQVWFYMKLVRKIISYGSYQFWSKQFQEQNQSNNFKSDTPVWLVQV